MDRITISDLEVWYCIGVPEAERAKPQRLLLTVALDVDVAPAAATDRVQDTVNYQHIVDDLLTFGKGRTWKLLERLVIEVAEHILTCFQPRSVTVEAKKFIIPQARYVSVSCTRSLNRVSSPGGP